MFQERPSRSQLRPEKKSSKYRAIWHSVLNIIIVIGTSGSQNRIPLQNAQLATFASNWWWRVIELYLSGVQAHMRAICAATIFGMRSFWREVFHLHFSRRATIRRSLTHVETVSICVNLAMLSQASLARLHAESRDVMVFGGSRALIVMFSFLAKKHPCSCKLLPTGPEPGNASF